MILTDLNDWFEITRDEHRGLRVLGKYQDDKLHIRHVQEIRDDFWQRNREMGEAQQRRANTQDHWRHVSRIPHAIYNEWLEKYGNPILDEDANKRWTQLLNSREFHKLRTHDGQL